MREVFGFQRDSDGVMLVHLLEPGSSESLTYVTCVQLASLT
jgi:hypothetical protein